MKIPALFFSKATSLQIGLKLFCVYNVLVIFIKKKGLLVKEKIYIYIYIYILFFAVKLVAASL